ncbi:DUF5992 family protein, partial [Photobacterium sp. OFAV2-7]|uniref:DUF5992 family protein n=1 Tax=Photobacterium sp. OFAV2-7 TaxID=2917748 RepID=UPI001EF7460E
MLKKLLSFSLLIGLSLPVNAGELVHGATILEVANTNNNGADFAIFIQGGAGICQSRIVFPERKKQSEESYKQAFSIALTALASGNKVRIHNFED